MNVSEGRQDLLRGGRRGLDEEHSAVIQAEPNPKARADALGLEVTERRVADATTQLFELDVRNGQGLLLREREQQSLQLGAAAAGSVHQPLRACRAGDPPHAADEVVQR
jgi:hypothetical protein